MDQAPFQVLTQGGDYVGRDKVTIQIEKWIQKPAAAQEAEQARQAEANRLEQGVRRLAAGLAQAVKQAPPAGRSPAPYKGLEAYSLADVDIFRGREQAIQEVLARLEYGPLCVLHAESGAGKTSLLQAGIAARLILSNHLPVYLRPYNRSPVETIKARLLPGMAESPFLKGAPLSEFLRQACQALKREVPDANPAPYLVLMLDQFEEFFQHQPQAVVEAFAIELADCLADPTLRVRWLLALRKEYFSNLADFRPRLNPMENDYRLRPLSRAEAVQAATFPLKDSQVSFEPGAVEQVLDDLGEQEITPAQLQLVCLALWRNAQQAGARQIDLEMYARLGGAHEILKNHLERVLGEALPLEQRPAAQALLETMVDARGQRRMRTRSQLLEEVGPAPEKLDALLSRLVDERLVHSVTPGFETSLRKELSYELAHDILAEQVQISPETRRRKEAQDLLEREVLNWRAFGALMRLETLRVVMAQRSALRLSPEEIELLARSALAAGIETESWLAELEPAVRQSILVEGLQSPYADARAGAAERLAGSLDETTAGLLLLQAAKDASAPARQAAQETLRSPPVSPAVQQMLLAGLEHTDEEVRATAAAALAGCLEASSVRRLCELATSDPQWTVQYQALHSLAAPGAQPFHPQVRQYWRACPEKTALLEKMSLNLGAVQADELLRQVGLHPPPALRLKAESRRVWAGVQTHPLRSALLLALTAGLYLLLAWQANLFPFHYWQSIPGAPQVALSTLTQNGSKVIVGSYDYGAFILENDAWSASREGLPTAVPPPGDPPDANVWSVDQFSAPQQQPGIVYALLRSVGVYQNPDGSPDWQEVGRGIPTFSGDSPTELAVEDGLALVAAGGEGLFAARLPDSSITGTVAGSQIAWQRINGEAGLPPVEFNAAGFDKDGMAYAGGASGLYTASDAYPDWSWQPALKDQFVRFARPGAGEWFFLVLGEGHDQAACWRMGQMQIIASFNFDAISALAAHPGDPEIFYIGTFLGNVYELHCSGEQRWLGRARLMQNITQLIYQPGQGIQPGMLIQLNPSGLFQRQMPARNQVGESSQ